MRYKLAALLICAIITVIAIYHNYEQAQLDGFWNAPQTFLDKSGADMMVLYLAPADMISSKRSAYLVLKRDGDLIVNTEFTVNIGWTGHNKFSFTTSTELHEAIPKKMCLETSNGKLTLSAGDTVYGVFYKNHELNELDAAKPPL